MKANTYAKPVFRKSTGAIVRIVKTTLCGTDIYIIKQDVPACRSGTMLGHESIGIVEEVFEGVSNFKKGDRSLISCVCS